MVTKFILHVHFFYTKSDYRIIAKQLKSMLCLYCAAIAHYSAKAFMVQKRYNIVIARYLEP